MEKTLSIEEINEILQTPTGKKTVVSEASRALNELSHMWVKWASPEQPDLFRNFVEAAFYDDEITGEKKVEELNKIERQETYSCGKNMEYDVKVANIRIATMYVACAFAVQAMKAANIEKDDLAWSYACDSQYWTGMLRWMFYGYSQKNKLSKDARSRAASNSFKNTPKFVAKKFVKECWDKWQLDPRLYKTQTEFANDVEDKFERDENGKTIISVDTVTKKWIPEWKGKKSNPAS